MSEKTQIGGVLHSDDLVLISVLAMPARPGTAGKIMSAMGDHELNVEFIAQTIGMTGKDYIIFCVKADKADEAVQILEGLKQEVHSERITRQDKVGLLFTFGPDFRFSPGIAGKVFKTLGRADINIISISTSIAAVSCVIEEDKIPQAVAALEAVFEIP